MKQILLAMIVFSICSCSETILENGKTVGNTNEIIRDKFVGTWICNDVSKNYAETTYKADGSLTAEVKVKTKKGVLKIYIAGTWEIINEYLVENYLESNYPKLLDKMPENRYKIITIENDIFTILSKTGDKHTHNRKY